MIIFPMTYDNDWILLLNIYLKIKIVVFLCFHAIIYTYIFKRRVDERIRMTMIVFHVTFDNDWILLFNICLKIKVSYYNM